MAAPRDPRLFLPYPELVEPSPSATPYRIRDSERSVGLPSPGVVDPASRRLWVPLRADGRGVSRHELAHVRWSPLALPPVPFDPALLAAIEDARVNLGLANVGLAVGLDAEARARVLLLAARDAKGGNAFAFFQRVVAALGTAAEAPLHEMLRDGALPLGPELLVLHERVAHGLRAAQGRGGEPVAPFATAVRLAREIAPHLRALGLLDPAWRARGPLATSGCVRVVEEPDERIEIDGPGAPGDEPDGDDVVPAGRLAVRTVPLPVALRGRGALSGQRASREGSAVRHPQRWYSDGAIFRRRVRVRGGTVLVDTSGSMNLRAPDLDAFLLRTPPALRVAIYSGDGDAGELRVVAEAGRRAALEDLKRFGSGNVVDAPALEWLARQPAPRVWVSDGRVSGVHDRPSRALVRRCGRIAASARIRRVATLDEAARLFGARPPG